MAEVVRMPKLSDTMTDGVVAEWHKKVGDTVEAGDLLAEIETDKATMEFESFQDGVLLHIGVEKGASAPVDSVLAILGEEGEDIDKVLAEAEKDTPKPESDDKEAEKESEESPAEEPEPKKEEETKESSPAPQPKSEASNTTAEGRVKASPLARKLAEEKGIDIQAVSGSGDGGRVVKRDIENYKPSAASAAAPQFATEGPEYTEEPVSQMRKTIARRLAESKFSAPHFYLNIDVDMENAMAARVQINNSIEGKVSFNDLVIKATALALKKNPAVNSSWLEDKIRYNNVVNIGVAVAVPEGLLVPVVRNANFKSLTQINGEVKEFAQKAKDKKLQPADWEGNTFTISNLGMFGIDDFTAIINPPDSCILAVGGIRDTPVVKDGQVVPGKRMKLTLSCDHRVVDGATGAQFLQDLKTLLENPVSMLA